MVKAHFALRWRFFFPRDPQGTMRVRIVEDPLLISSNQVFQMRAQNEKLTDGYPGEPFAITQSMRNLPSQHSFVAEGLEATEDCYMDTP